MNICTECSLPVSFSKAVVQRENAREIACRMMEEACVQRDRAEAAEAEVKRLETLTRIMRNNIDRCIAELYGIPEARTATRWLERTYAEASDPCLNCDTKHIMSGMGKEIAAQHIALNKAVSFICGCPPFGQKAEPCNLMKDPPGQCAECWTSHLLEQARTNRTGVTI